MASARITMVIPGPHGNREVSLSSPNRVVFPEVGITKHELAEYLVNVGGPFLAANGNRPISLERFGDTIDGERFFSKNPPKGAPDYIEQVMVVYPSGRSHPQLVLTEPAAVVWAAQMNTVVFHPWASLASDTDNPVELRIDLDPQPGTDFADAVPAAIELRAVLREAGLEPRLKTSGNRGIHVFAPIVPNHEFLDVRHAVIAAARELERRMPARVTTNWWKEERGERIFVDYNQANRDRTMAGAYSPRALGHAPVSTPISWEELPDVDPRAFTVRTIPARLRDIGDPWADFGTAAATTGTAAATTDTAAATIDTLLSWWQRDVEAGLGELPFPPDYPKMPGEPPRVQPSRAKKVAAEAGTT